MKELCIIIVILIVRVTVYSQTNVSGTYFSNTTWGITGSPYHVVGDVQIPVGITLTIDPGVQIIFYGNKEILIKGIIMAIGTDSLDIDFTGGTSGNAMLMFKSANLSSSQLSHINFTGPKTSLQLADESSTYQDVVKNSGILTVKNSSFVNTTIRTKGYNSTASLVIDSSTVSTSTIIGVYARSEPIEIKDSYISNCTIISEAYNFGITLRNCFANNSDFKLDCCGANFHIIKSTIENSNFSEYTTSGDNDGYYITIEESQIINSPLPFAGSSAFSVIKSHISYHGGTAIQCSSLTMSCTQIEGNGSGTAIYLGSGTNNISKSTIFHNSIAIKNWSSNGILTIDSSNIYNNTQYNIQNISVQNTLASANWWGTTDSITIAHKIYDYYDDINYGIVTFSNKLNAFYDSPSCPDSMTFPTSINKDEKELIVSGTDLNIYPNPASVFVHLEFNNLYKGYGGVEVEIINTMGQVVYGIYLNKSFISKIIDVSNFNRGIYFFKVQLGNEVIIKKLIIQ